MYSFHHMGRQYNGARCDTSVIQTFQLTEHPLVQMHLDKDFLLYIITFTSAGGLLTKTLDYETRF